MDREIVLKAWHIKGKFWLSDFSLSNDGQTVYCIGERYNTETEVTVIQSTNLNDKTGKEIFEGDICHIFTDTPTEIIYCNGAFGYNDASDCFISFAQNMWFFWANSNSKEIELLGNKFENPELLTANK